MSWASCRWTDYQVSTHQHVLWIRWVLQRLSFYSRHCRANKQSDHVVLNSECLQLQCFMVNIWCESNFVCSCVQWNEQILSKCFFFFFISQIESNFSVALLRYWRLVVIISQFCGCLSTLDVWVHLIRARHWCLQIEINSYRRASSFRIVSR